LLLYPWLKHESYVASCSRVVTNSHVIASKACTCQHMHCD
jgi:hypothetical protein